MLQYLKCQSGNVFEGLSLQFTVTSILYVWQSFLYICGLSSPVPRASYSLVLVPYGGIQIYWLFTHCVTESFTESYFTFSTHLYMYRIMVLTLKVSTGCFRWDWLRLTMDQILFNSTITTTSRIFYLTSTDHPVVLLNSLVFLLLLYY